MSVTVLHSHSISDGAVDFVTANIHGELERRGDYYRLHHKQPVSAETLSLLRRRLDFDINPIPADFFPQQVRLLISEMDSTLINIECVDEIADFANLKPEVAAITEAAMRGELNFAESLLQRVSLLQGLDEQVLQRVYTERLRLNPGAEMLLTGLKQHGIKTALVSGGFTFFTDQLKQRLSLDFTLANVLAVENGRLTGKVVGSIVGADAKRDFLLQLCEELTIVPEQVVAVGDGANDLKMMGVAGLSVAYHAKPRVQEQADTALNFSGLEGILHLLDMDGYYGHDCEPGQRHKGG